MAYMRRRTLIATLGATSLAGCFGTDDDDTGEDDPEEDADEDADTSEETDEQDDSEQEEEEEGNDQLGAVDPDPVELSGSGSEMSDSFQIHQGLTVLEVEPYETVDLELLNTDGGRHRSLGWETRSWMGTIPLTVPARAYMLDVDTNDDWRVTIREPEVGTEDIITPPVSFSGNDTLFVGPIEFNGDSTMGLEHAGSGDCDVKILSLDGEVVESPIKEESGIFDVQTELEYERHGWVLMLTHGDYEVTIE